MPPASTEEDAPAKPQTKLPQVWKYAIYHPNAGLIVSPMSRVLPRKIAAKITDDYGTPRLVADDQIWMGFYPRCSLRGKIFAPLRLGRLDKHIVYRLRNNVRVYGLPVPLACQWAHLEVTLLSVAQSCLEQHPLASHFPSLRPPLLPSAYGLLEERESFDSALRAATDSREAFRMLSAYVTFAISLWLTQYSDDCHAEAWDMLANRVQNPLSRLWLEELQDSTVCDLSGGIRPGVFLDPYITRWGCMLHRFTRASVPVWLLWGHNSGRDVSDSGIVGCYYPPAKFIEDAKRQQVSYGNIILPHSVLPHEQTSNAASIPGPAPTIPSTRSIARPHSSLPPIPWDSVEIRYAMAETQPSEPHVDRSLIVHKYSRQRPGETWEAFFARMETQEQQREKVEKPVEKQSREAIKKLADKGTLTKKATVFEWQQDEVDSTVYRRTRIDRSLAEDTFEEYDPSQRRFWSHVNEWDLCPLLPARSSSGEICGMSGVPFAECEGSSVDHSPADRDVASVSGEFSFDFASIFDYLKFRHGFDARQGSWNPQAHVFDNKALAADDDEKALTRLLYGPANNPRSLKSSVDFYNTAANEKLSFKDLPASWDISPRVPRPIVICDQRRLALQIAYTPDGKTLYVLSPPRDSKDTSRWFVATTSATAVLFAYRQGWTTMHETGRGLLERGIPFRTVLKVDKSRIPRQNSGVNLRSRSHALGIRPPSFEPTQVDFAAYLEERDRVLKSPSGRALRLKGGIVGRIASEVVPEVEVLDGPDRGDELIGSFGVNAFVDDGVDSGTLDVVSGVYYIKNSQSAQTNFTHRRRPKFECVVLESGELVLIEFLGLGRPLVS